MEISHAIILGAIIINALRVELIKVELVNPALLNFILSHNVELTGHGPEAQNNTAL